MKASIAPSPTPNPRAWRGSAELVFAREGDRTLPIHICTRAPFKVQRSLYPEGSEICYATLVHTAGGMVGGDVLDQSIHLHAGSQVFLTTPAAGKIYRTMGEPCLQTATLRIEPGAYLEWLPQDAIAFNGANYIQNIRVDLSPGGQILLWDIARLGRTARGEQLLQGEWRSQVEVWQEDLPLWIDHQFVRGGEAMTSSPHALAGYPVMGTLARVGRSFTDAEMEDLREAIAFVPPQYIGLTRSLNGLVCRYRGTSSQMARQCFTRIWQRLRYFERGKMPDVPRVWR
ncbi:MAG: urease accessory protein UreD [Cyanobacteria bacterium J06639_1]